MVHHPIRSSILAVCTPLALATIVAAQNPPQINEIRIDQPSTDNDEYFELAGDASLSLDGLTYIVIGDGSGGSGVIEAVIPLAGLAIMPDGLFCAAESTMTIAVPDYITSLNFENSDNVTHMLVEGFTGANGDDLDTDDDGTLDVTPWTAIVDCVALVEDPAGGDHFYCGAQVGPDGTYVPGHVLRCPDGVGNWLIGKYDLGACGLDTPGDPNQCTQGMATFRNDTGGTNTTGYVAVAPIIDTTWTATVDLSGTTNGLGGIASFETTAEVYLPGIGDYLLVNILDPGGDVIGLVPQSGAGVLTWNLDLPCDPSVLGSFVATQGWGFGGADGITLHNAYDLVVGWY